MKKSTKSKLKRFAKRTRETTKAVGEDLTRFSEGLNKHSSRMASGITGSLRPMPLRDFPELPEPPQLMGNGRRQNPFNLMPSMSRPRNLQLVKYNGKLFYQREDGLLIPVKQKNKAKRRKKKK